MKKITAALAASALALGGIALAAAPASATYSTPPEVCTPADAWQEIIEHPAVGEPTITIENPDYVPATPEQTVADGYMKWN